MLTALQGLSVAIEFLHVEFSKGSLVTGKGIGNSVSIVVDNHLVFATWGEIVVNTTKGLVGISPVFPKAVKVGSVLYDPRLIASFGIESSRGVTYVKWSSSPVSIANGSTSFTWRGGGEVLSSTSRCALVRIWGSIEVSRNGVSLKQIRSHTILVPLATLIPKSVEVYAAIGGKLANSSILANIARGRFVATPLLIAFVDNATLIIGGALIEYLPSLEAWRLWLGITIDQNRSVTSNLFVIVAKGIDKKRVLSIASTYATVRNPLIALRNMWNALTSVPHVKTVTTTITVVKELRPFQAASIAITGVVVGTFLGFLITTLITRRGSKP